jgi:transcriptional regulator with XRE-family HTH domain
LSLWILRLSAAGIEAMVTTPEQVDRDADVAERALAEALCRLRAGSPLSLRELAKLAHISDSALSRYLRGQAIPSWKVVEGLASACSGDLGDLRARWEAASAARRRRRSQRSAGEVAGAEADLCQLEPEPSGPRTQRWALVAGLAAAVIAAAGITAWGIVGGRPAAAQLLRPAKAAVKPSPLPPSDPPDGSCAQGIPPNPNRSSDLTRMTSTPRTTLADPQAGLTEGTPVTIVSTDVGSAPPDVIDLDNWGTDAGSALHLWRWRIDVAYHIETQFWIAKRSGKSGSLQLRNVYSRLCLARSGSIEPI